MPFQIGAFLRHSTMKIKHETRLHCYNERSDAENNFK